MLIGIDFDHTIVDSATAEPLPGVRDAISRLRELGHKILVHSCNNPRYIKQWMLDHDIRHDYIWEDKGKPVCDIYIDDRAYRFPFNGDWNEELPKILDTLKLRNPI